MDDRVRRYLESETGVPLEAFGTGRIAVCESVKRTDEQGNRVLIQRLRGMNGLLATVLAGRAESVERVLTGLTSEEVFCPLGAAEICRSLGVDFEPNEYYTYGLDYCLTSLIDFRPALSRHPVRALGKKDIPEEQFALRMGERRPSEEDDFVWAFACDCDAPAFRPDAESAPFGSRCASISIVIWKQGPVATYGVGTDEACRGQGYALAAVSAATRWILEQGEVPVYGAYANNIPSLRTARRLGFSLFRQHMAV